MLEKYVHDPAIVGKVTMIKSSQAGSEFSGLPFSSTTMGSVFMRQPRSVGAESSRATKSPAVSEAGSLPGQPQSGANRHTPQPSPATYAQTAAPQPATALAGFDQRPLPVFGTLGKSIIVVNADGHRIDLPLPPKSAAASESFNRKTHGGGKRFCNMHHLYGLCTGNCGYLHGQLTAGEKLVMRQRLRLVKCYDGGNCRNPLCFYAHHCACHGQEKGQLKKCNFPVSMHGVSPAGWREVDTGAGSV